MFNSGGFDLGSAYAKIILDASGVDSGIQQAKRSLSEGVQSIGAGLQNFGGQMAGIGASLGVIAAPAALFLKNATDQFNTFNEAMTNIQAVTGNSAAQMKDLSAQILDIGKNSRAGPQAVATAFYDIAGGIVDASVRMPTLIAAVKTAEAGNANLAGTTKALISIMNGYGFSADKAGMVTDVLTQTVAKGVGTMDDFASALPNVAGMANSVGISFQDLGAMMAFLTTKGVSAAEASTQLSSMMTSLLNPSKEMTDALKALGYQNGTAAIKALGLVGTFKKLKDSGYDVAQLGGRVEALRGTIALTGEGAQSFLDNFSNGLNGLTEATQRIQDASPAAQADFFNSAMSTLAITIGQALAPAMNRLLESLLPIINSFIDWVTKNPEVVAQIAQIVMIVAGLSAGLLAAGAVISAVGAIISGFGVIIGLVFSPIGLIIAGVVAAVLWLIDHFKLTHDKILLYGSLIKLYAEYYFNGVVLAIQKVIDKVKEFIDKHPDLVIAFAVVGAAVVGPSLAVSAFGLVMSGVGIIGGILTTVLGGLFTALGILLSPIVLLSLALGALLIVASSTYPGGLVQLFKDAAESARKLADIFFMSLIPGVSGAKDAIAKAVQTLTDLYNIIQLILTGKVSIGDVIGQIGQEIGNNAGIQPNSNMGKAIRDTWGNLPTIGSSGGGSRGFGGGRDSGGAGFADMAYLIGRGAQPELFMPHTSGTFIPNADKLGGGDTYNVNIVLPDSALGDPNAARAAGQIAADSFEERIIQRRRSRGG